MSVFKILKALYRRSIQRVYYRFYGGFLGVNIRIKERFKLVAVKPYKVYIGDNTFINSNVVLDASCANIHIGKGCQIAFNTVISTAVHTAGPLRKLSTDAIEPIEIADNVWIGANAVILPGVHLGQGSTIGAGSVVTINIPAGATAVGSPARVINQLDMQ